MRTFRYTPYTVSLAIPTLFGDSPRDAAEVFVRVLGDWIAGSLDTLALDVTDEHTNALHIIDVRAADLFAASVRDAIDRDAVMDGDAPPSGAEGRSITLEDNNGR